MKKLGKECSFCEEHPWVGPPWSRVPGPMPDYDRMPEYHYKHVSATPYEINNIQRQVDDFKPRKMLDIAFKEKVVRLNDEESIDQFCNTYIVGKELVKKRLEHLQVLEIKKNKRSFERKTKAQQEQNKKYEDIDWNSHYERNTLCQLSAATLNKYIEHHNIENCFNLKKTEKIKVIQHHVVFANLRIMVQHSEDDEENIPQVASTDENEYETDSDSDSVTELSRDDNDDVVAVTCGNIDSSEENDDNELISDNECSGNIDSFEEQCDILDLFVTTRSRRIANSWRCSYFK